MDRQMENKSNIQLATRHLNHPPARSIDPSMEQLPWTKRTSHADAPALHTSCGVRAPFLSKSNVTGQPQHRRRTLLIPSLGLSFLPRPASAY